MTARHTGTPTNSGAPSATYTQRTVTTQNVTIACPATPTAPPAPGRPPTAGPAAPPAPAPPSPHDLAAAVRASLSAPAPATSASPSWAIGPVVGLHTWLWIRNWTGQTATASLAGVTATVTAHPTNVRWTFTKDDDPTTRADDPYTAPTTITCPDAGRPYNPHVTDDQQSTDCGIDLSWHGTYTVRTTVTWNVTWHANTGDAGTLTPLTATTTVRTRARSYQAVTN